MRFFDGQCSRMLRYALFFLSMTSGFVSASYSQTIRVDSDLAHVARRDPSPYYRGSAKSILLCWAAMPSSNYITDPNSGLSASTIARYQLLLPHPQFTGFEGEFSPIASSIYHSVQIRAEKKFANGLQFLVSYSFSKSIDDASATDDSISWLGGGTRGGDTIGVQDPNNLRPERAASVFDIPHDLQFSYVYALPTGRGKRVGGKMHPVARCDYRRLADERELGDRKWSAHCSS